MMFQDIVAKPQRPYFDLDLVLREVNFMPTGLVLSPIIGPVVFSWAGIETAGLVPGLRTILVPGPTDFTRCWCGLQSRFI